MRRWDVGLPLRAAGALPGAVSAVWAGASVAAGEGPADAILVLGARVLPGGVASGSLRARAEAAAALWHAGAAPVIVATGATHGQPPGEAVVARDLMLACGVRADAILVEEKSRNTRGNFLFARGLVPGPRVFVVTEPFHMGRALHLARLTGYEPLPWPVLSAAWGRPLSRWRLLARDSVSMAFVLAGG